jgi:hypothetical protein
MEQEDRAEEEEEESSNSRCYCFNRKIEIMHQYSFVFGSILLVLPAFSEEHYAFMIADVFKAHCYQLASFLDCFGCCSGTPPGRCLITGWWGAKFD